MQIIIFSSPQRKRMLNRLLKELDGYDVYIIDDPNTFGKRNFWKRYQLAFEVCRKSRHDWFLFMPDDVKDVNLYLIEIIKERIGQRKAVFNLINDGRLHCWGKTFAKSPDIEIDGVSFEDRGFYDCGGLMNRNTLNTVDIDEVKNSWFNRHGENVSSGVGFQLTRKFRREQIPMYVPEKSLAYHGNHKSIMHPNERRTNKLISK